VPYKYRDLCQDDYADYLACMQTHPKTIENPFVYMLPMSQFFTRCKALDKQWRDCEDYRERQVLEVLREVYEMQKKKP
jgi:hypothetical protein